MPIFNAIVFDVLIIVLLLLIIFIGVLKGIKHTLINFGLLAASIALSFTSFLNIIKLPIVNFLSSKIVLGVGISEEVKIGVNLIYLFVASLVLTVLFYLIFRLAKHLIFMIIKKNMIKANKLPPRLDVWSRVFGGVFSLILYGAIVIVSLSAIDNPLVGGNKTISNGYVTKYIEKTDELLINVFNKDVGETYEDKLLIKLVKGDLYVKVSEETIEDIKVLSELVSSGKLVPTDLSSLDQTVKYMEHLLRFVTNNLLDEKGIEKDGFEEVVELTRNIVTKTINEINILHKGDTPLEANNTLAISNSLRKLGLVDINEIFETVFVIK